MVQRVRRRRTQREGDYGRPRSKDQTALPPPPRAPGSQTRLFPRTGTHQGSISAYPDSKIRGSSGSVRSNSGQDLETLPTPKAVESNSGIQENYKVQGNLHGPVPEKTHPAIRGDPAVHPGPCEFRTGKYLGLFGVKSRRNFFLN